MTPDWSALAARSALPMSRLQIEPDRPYGVALARRSASSSVSNGMTDDHRAEDLLARDAHVVVDAVEHRRHEVRAVGQGRIVGRRPADDDRRALAQADLDVVLDPVALLGADERPDLGRLVGRVADLDGAGRLGEQLDDPLVDRALDEDPAPGAAVLPGVVEDAVRRFLRELLEVGVGEHDVRALAAELERDLLHVAGGQPHDLLAGRGLAGERDLADARVGRDRRTGRAAGSGHDVEDAGRDARLERQLAEPDRGQRRVRRRLQDRGVAGGQRRRDLPRRPSAAGSSTARSARRRRSARAASGRCRASTTGMVWP